MISLGFILLIICVWFARPSMRPFQTLNGVLAWFKYPPVLARAILIPSIGLPVLIKLRIITFFSVFFSWEMLVKKYQLWRLCTPFFVAPLNINLLFDSFLRYQALSHLEFMAFGRYDNVVFLLFGFIFGIVFALLDAKAIILTPVLTMYIIYVWSMLNPDMMIQFYFIPIKSKYFPWALLVVNVLIFGTYLPSELAGILIGNLYVAMFKWSVHSKKFISGSY